MKTITINVPDDCEVKIVKKEEKEKPIIRTYRDLINNSQLIKGYWVNFLGVIESVPLKCATTNTNHVAASEKIAKSMRAMAMISQLIPFYGKEITDREWEDPSIRKYVLNRGYSNVILKYSVFGDYSFLAFHTAEQRDAFLKYNERLVKDYLMID